MSRKKKIGIGAVAIALLVSGIYAAVRLTGDGDEIHLAENQSYVYAYVSQIKGNEITYSVLDESVVTAYLEQQETSDNEEENLTEEKQDDNDNADRGEMPSGDFSGEMQDRGEMPSGDFSGEMPDRGEMPSGDFSGEMPDRGEVPAQGENMMSTEQITTLIPVGVTVHTQADTETTFQRLASGDMIKMIVETNDEGEEVITEIWML